MLSVVICHLMKSLVKLALAILLATIVCPLGLLAQRKAYTVVIDPGHGGHDAGACAFGRKEKDINLAIPTQRRALVPLAQRPTYWDCVVLMIT